ncbi:LysE family transporter [archaeon]|nr:LysE family transporter [archaeon]
MTSFISNFILGIALALPLGPVTLETLNRGLKGGLRKSLWVVAGTMLAELIYFSLVFFGLSKIAETFIVQNVLGGVGVVFLIYLGIGNIKDYFDKSLKEIEDPKRHPFFAGFLITFLYPLNVFLWAGIIAVAMNSSPSFVVTSGVLWGVLTAYLIVAVVGSFGKKFMNQKRVKYVSLIAGIFLIFYGLKMFWNIFII